jgi:hypothetical protein
VLTKEDADMMARLMMVLAFVAVGSLVGCAAPAVAEGESDERVESVEAEIQTTQDRVDTSRDQALTPGSRLERHLTDRLLDPGGPRELPGTIGAGAGSR